MEKRAAADVGRERPVGISFPSLGVNTLPVPTPATSSILGRSRAIELLIDTIERVAATPRTTVLVLGESGSGKELVARAVHERSRRAQSPFVAVNCAALSESLLEAELFGYEPGAFTGAHPKGRAGLFSAAQGGSLLLDEIGELERGLQAKLLRVLQERSFRPVGAHVDQPCDVRIIASTNRDLATMVEAGEFREDLYYRLNVMSIRVPPLRERGDDVLILAEHFQEQCAREFGRRFDPLSQHVRERLCSHTWPGNVRELRNAIERAALLAQDVTLDCADLELARPLRTAGRATRTVSARSLESVERAHVLRVLEESAGNRSAAARVLGVNRATLYNKLRTWGIASEGSLRP